MKILLNEKLFLLPGSLRAGTLGSLILASLLLGPGLTDQATAEEWKPPASPESLQPSLELPDLFTFADGSKVKTKADWERRREEMKKMEAQIRTLQERNPSGK